MWMLSTNGVLCLLVTARGCCGFHTVCTCGKPGCVGSFQTFLPLLPSCASLLRGALMGFTCLNEYLVLRSRGILLSRTFLCCAADLRCKMSDFSHFPARDVRLFMELFKKEDVFLL